MRFRQWRPPALAFVGFSIARGAFAAPATVQIVGPDGKPAAGMTVFVDLLDGSGTPSRQTTTGADGMVLADSAQTITVAPAVGWGLGGGFVGPVGKKPRVFHLHSAGAPLVVHVVDSAGKPMAGVAVAPTMLTLPGGPG